jgi:hypothetical protein
MIARVAALAAVVAITASAGCSGSGGGDRYDISPIFPLTADKCQTYHGEQSGEGFGSSCMVTKSECERAVSDWRQAMRNVNDAIQFSCR